MKKTIKKRYYLSNFQKKKNKTNKYLKYKKWNKQFGGISANTVENIENAYNASSLLNTNNNTNNTSTNSNISQNIQNDYMQGQNIANSIYPDTSDENINTILNESGDTNTELGSILYNNQDDVTKKESESTQKNISKKITQYNEFIREYPSFLDSTLLHLVVKPAAYLIDKLGSLLNIDMNNPEKVKSELDEMANSVQDPVERKRILNYNAQVLAVYLTATKPAIDVISGVFSEQISQVVGDLINNMYNDFLNGAKKIIPGYSFSLLLFNDIPLMITNIIQAMTTITQLTSSTLVPSLQSVQQLNESIMKKTDANLNLAIEEQKKADILEKQNKLVELILEKPEIIDSYVKFLNNANNNNTFSQDTREKILQGGNKNHKNINKDRLMKEISKSLQDYNIKLNI